MKFINVLTIILVIIAVIFVSILIIFPGEIGLHSSEENYMSAYFNPNSVNRVSITITEENWDDMLKNPLDEEYHLASVTINDDTYHGIGIRTKGLTSLGMVANSDSDRYSFKIKADEYFNGQTFLGLNKFVLNNNYRDSSYMKEYLSYQLLTELGVPTPAYAYAAVYLNGKYWGLYLMVEAVEEDFAARNFGMNYGQLYKPDKTFGNRSKGLGGSELIYIDENIESYPDIFDNAVFTNVTNTDKQRVITALRHLSEGTDLEKYINVDEVLKFFAVNTAFVNLDSYISSMHHNYYLYEDMGQLSMIPWDWNVCFGESNSLSSQESINFPIDTPAPSNINISERPMIGSLLAVDSYKNLYHDYLRIIATEFFGNSYEERINKIDAMISPFVEKDPTAFYTFEEYKNGVEYMKVFGKHRAESILGQLNGTIPSTWDGQFDDSSNLIDATDVEFYRKMEPDLF